MKCPKCGHKFKSENQANGGKARWRGMTKKARSAAASDAAKARWAKSGNAELRHSADSAAPQPNKTTNEN